MSLNCGHGADFGQTWSGQVLLKEGCHREIQGNVPGDVWSYPDLSNTCILVDVYLLEPGDRYDPENRFGGGGGGDMTGVLGWVLVLVTGVITVGATWLGASTGVCKELTVVVVPDMNV